MEIYSADELKLLQSTNYGHISDIDMMVKYVELEKNITKLWNSEWVNVYNIEEFKTNKKDNPKFSDVVKGEIYTIVYDGKVYYVVQIGNKRKSYNYYPGNGYSKITRANTQEMYVDTTKYSALAYNINDNNYFKLRDIAKMLDGTVKCFDIEYDGDTNSIDMLSLFPYTEVGGELTSSDGVDIRRFYATVKETADPKDDSQYPFNRSDGTLFISESAANTLKADGSTLAPAFTIKVYSGNDVYAVQKAGASATKEFCTNHEYTAQIPSIDRVYTFPTCQAEELYYYSCRICGKCEFNPNHVDYDHDMSAAEIETKKMTFGLFRIIRIKVLGADTIIPIYPRVADF